MQNQPFSAYQSESDPPLPGSPQRRVRHLTLAFLLMLCVVGVRVVHVQSAIAERFLTGWDETERVEVVVPARDGRILTRDGVVLAQDETRYDVAIAYRWLESPPDATWLRKQAYRRLPAGSRTQPEELARAAQAVIEQRAELFRQLAQLSGHPVIELEQRAAKIQADVERVTQAVEARRQKKNSPAAASPASPSTGWRGLWSLVVDELTSPPDRFADSPIVIREALEDHVLLEDVPLEVAAALESQPARFPGVRIQATTRRSYPEGDLAAHLVGVRRDAPAQQEERAPDSGIEKAFDAQLHGTAGRLERYFDRHGELLEEHSLQPVTNGADVSLTIDSRLQRAAETLLDDLLATPASPITPPPPTGAVLIAMDVRSGDLLTLATSPRPPLSILASPSTEQWNQLLNDPRQPLFPRGTRMALPAGSVFKVVTASAGLDAGVASPESVRFCRGFLDEPDQFRCLFYRRSGQGHGEMQLADALCESCNVYFYQLARELGPLPLIDWASRFGFGQPTGIELPGESAGTLPSPAAVASRATWQPGTTLQLAIGQGPLLVTPLQVVRMMGAIANGGTLVRPRLVQQTPGEELEPAAHDRAAVPGLDSRVLYALRAGLDRVVQDPRGTGRAARIDMLALAGKTGTAEVADKADHAWFTGYAPADDPRVAFVVVLEHGGSGSRAALIARDYLLEMLGVGELRPSTALTAQPLGSVTVD